MRQCNRSGKLCHRVFVSRLQSFYRNQNTLQIKFCSKLQARRYHHNMAISHVELSASESESRLGGRCHGFYVASQLNLTYAHPITLIYVLELPFQACTHARTHTSAKWQLPITLPKTPHLLHLPRVLYVLSTSSLIFL